MSFKSQEQNMHRLAEMVRSSDGKSTSKKEERLFLNIGKAFLRELGKDLGLRHVRVTASNEGVAECCLTGMGRNSGLFVSIKQPRIGDDVMIYHTIRNLKDHKGKHNESIYRPEMVLMSYERLINKLKRAKMVVFYGRAA